jgi:hypothetical protein
MAQLQQQILGYLPPTLRQLLEGGPRRALVEKIDATVVVYNDSVLHLESSKSSKLESDEAEHGHSVEAIARACKTVLGSQPQEHSILLLLPPAEFVSTSLELPGVSSESLISALKLQVDALLPAYEEELTLAVNPRSVADGDSHIALWMASSRITEFFDAFARQGLFLAAIKPRVLALPESAGDSLIIDSDLHSKTAVVLKAGIIKRWLHVCTMDLSQEQFAEQWQQLLASTQTEQTRELDAVEDFIELQDKNSHSEYSLFPEGALQARKRIEKGKQLLAGAVLAGVALLLAATPFILQSFEFRGLSARLELQRQMSAEPRSDQAVVVNFGNQWGAINDFPQQGVRQAMFSLQAVLSPERLSSLEVSEGLIKIQGTSSEPQALLERLEQSPMFTEVIFSRATNNSRYYIDLRLGDVNFEAYTGRYFPDD